MEAFGRDPCGHLDPTPLFTDEVVEPREPARVCQMPTEAHTVTYM